jgi:glycosyltransferase involved in cell wall biosynthesis
VRSARAPHGGRERIGVVTTSYPHEPGDAAGAFVADRALALLAAGHEIEVLAAAGARATFEPLLRSSMGGRLTVTRLPARVGGGADLFGGPGAPEMLEAGGARAALAAARFSAELAAAVRARAPFWTRVESHWLAPCALAVVSGAPSLPHRAVAHSGDVALLERVPLGRSLARVLTASGARLVFVSEALRRRFGALAGRLSGTVERLPVPSTLFRPTTPRPDEGARAALGLQAARPTIVAVGRLVAIKGFDLLVRACAPARAHGTPVQLAIVGDGPERPRLRRLADRLGVALTMPGLLPRSEVGGWLRAADLYAQPSRVLANGRTEGLPLATLEALASGLPVVVSDSGGLGELAGHGPAVTVVPAGNVPALRAALRDGLARCATSCVAM